MALSPPAACGPGCQPPPLAATVVGQAFAMFLAREVAQGAAAPETQRSDHSQGRAWATWCQRQGVCLATAAATAVKTYRQALVAAGYQAASIAHTLAILRRFYAALQAAGLRTDNPVQGVHPPRDRRALERGARVSEADLGRLLALVPRTATAAALRDRVLLALLGVQGLRTVEVTRANVADVRAGEPALLRVRGKTRDRLLALRPDVMALLQAYWAARGAVAADGPGTPLLTARGTCAGQRLSRRGVRYVVDAYLRRAGVKQPGVAAHALRHTAATLAYQYTRDLRAVQHMLGHADPRTTARYAHLVERLQHNPALAVPVEV